MYQFYRSEIQQAQLVSLLWVPQGKAKAASGLCFFRGSREESIQNLAIGRIQFHGVVLVRVLFLCWLLAEGCSQLLEETHSLAHNPPPHLQSLQQRHKSISPFKFSASSLCCLSLLLCLSDFLTSAREISGFLRARDWTEHTWIIQANFKYCKLIMSVKSLLLCNHNIVTDSGGQGVGIFEAGWGGAGGAGWHYSVYHTILQINSMVT